MFEAVLSTMLVMCPIIEPGQQCEENKITEEVEAAPVQQRGLASYYGSGKQSERGMHGTVTANGEPFEPLAPTCASRTIPLGTVVIVRRVKTGDWTMCRVNDRGPYGARLYDGAWTAMLPYQGRWKVLRRGWENKSWYEPEYYEYKPGTYRGVIDLSVGTAKELNFDFDKGLNEVEIRYFEGQKEQGFPYKLLED